MKFDSITKNPNGTITRRYDGIVYDYMVTGNARSGGYVVHAEAWTKERQQKLFRVIVGRTLADAVKKIEQTEALSRKNFGDEKRPRNANYKRR
jgi:hypothetical protein